MNSDDARVLLLLVILSIIFAFYQPLSKSFSVDEGQYMLVAKKMLDGWVPYRDIIDNKPFGFYLLLTPAVLLGGSNMVIIRLYGALAESLAAFLVFLVGKRLKNRPVGVIGTLFYICICAIPGISGFSILTEPFANIFLIAVFYFLLSNKKTYPEFFLIGVLAAISCFIRQSCIFVFIPVIFDLAYYNKSKDKKKVVGALLLGVGVVAVPMLLYLAINSALWDAVYWCVYAPMLFLNGGRETSVNSFLQFSFLLYPLILLALVTLRETAREKKLLWICLLSSFLMVRAGYALFHNYLLVGPPLAVLAALGGMELYELLNDKGRLVNVYKGVFILLCVSTIAMVVFEVYLVALIGMDNGIYDQQWGVSEYISSHTEKNDGIFVFLGDPFIYYISDRKPVTPMTFFSISFMRSASDEQKNEYIFEPLEKSKPKYFVMDPLMYENDSSIMPVERYLDANYTHVEDWGIFHLYERKGE